MAATAILLDKLFVYISSNIPNSEEVSTEKKDEPNKTIEEKKIEIQEIKRHTDEEVQ